MSHHLDPWRMNRLRAGYAAGLSVREVAAYAQCSIGTATKWRAALVDFDAKCDCGAHGGHRGWCRARLMRHPKRQQMLERLGWTKQSRTKDSKAAIIKALSVIEPQTSEMLSAMTGLALSTVVSTASYMAFDRLITHRTIEGRWWHARSDESFLAFDHQQAEMREQAREHAGFHQEMQQWRQAKRTLASVRNWLLDHSPSAPKASKPAQTSPR